MYLLRTSLKLITLLILRSCSNTKRTNMHLQCYICCVCSQGVCVNLNTLDQVSPLHGACLQGHTACAKLLMENGANVSKAPLSGYVFSFINMNTFKMSSKEDKMFCVLIYQNPPLV